MFDFKPSSVPESACCITCGYLLRDLPKNACPECGRAFDPADPMSYAPSRRSRSIRRWTKRAAIAIGAAVILFAVCPRGMQRGKLTLTCGGCGQVIAFERWQLLCPRWMPRYAGRTTRTVTEASASTVHTDGQSQGTADPSHCAHYYGYSVSSSGGYVATSVNGSIRPAKDKFPMLNDHDASPKHAAAALYAFMDPWNSGVWLGLVDRTVGTNVSAVPVSADETDIDALFPKVLERDEDDEPVEP